MYEVPSKTCVECQQTKYVFEFKRVGTWASPKCKECIKKTRKLTEREMLTKTAPPCTCWWTKKAKWKGKNA